MSDALRRVAALPVAAPIALLFVVHVAIAVALRHSFEETRYVTLDELGKSLAHGHGFELNGRPAAEDLPLYPLVLGAVYATVGRHWWSVAALQTLLDAGSVLMLYLLARRLFDRRVALLAALGFAVYPYEAAQAAQLIDTSLFIFTLLGFLYFLVRAADSGSVKLAAAAGVTAGLAYLVRPTVIAIAIDTPIMLAALGLRRRAVALQTAAAAAAMIVVLVPWTVRNAVQYHAFLPGAAKNGINFWHGNSPHANDFISHGRNLDEIASLPDDPKPPRSYDQVRADNWYLHRGLDWVRAHPGQWAEGLLIKLEAFWSWSLNPRSRGDTHLKDILYTVSYAPLSLLALLGALLLAARRRWRELLFLGTPIVLFTLVHMAVFGYSRLRLPLDLLLMILAAFATVAAWDRLRTR